MKVTTDNFLILDDIPIDVSKSRMILRLWKDRCHKGARAHYMTSEKMLWRSSILTTINAVASISVVVLVNAGWIQEYFFRSLEDKPIFAMIAGLSGLLMVLATVLQYIYHWGDRSNAHKAAGSEFSNLQRKIERYLVADSIKMATIHNINRDYSYITKIYPLVPSRVWRHKKFLDLTNRIVTREGELETMLSRLSTRNSDEEKFATQIGKIDQGNVPSAAKGTPPVIQNP